MNLLLFSCLPMQQEAISYLSWIRKVPTDKDNLDWCISAIVG
jgi:hypothetical protein